jgi:hypothetical protein
MKCYVPWGMGKRLEGTDGAWQNEEEIYALCSNMIRVQHIKGFVVILRQMIILLKKVMSQQLYLIDQFCI